MAFVSPPHLIRREVPKALSAVCLKAMALKPEDRYESALALADDVERWLADEPVIAHHDSVTDRAARWLRHNRTWFRAVMIATLLIIGILITSVFLIDGQRQIAEDARGRAMQLAVERTKLANRESELRKQAEWQSTNRSFEQSLLLCERVDATTGLLSLVDNLKEAEQIGATDLATSIRAQLGQWQGAVHSLEKVIEFESSIRWILHTPDRKRMLIGTNEKTFMVDAQSGESIGKPLPMNSRTVAAVIHPTDQTFATVSEDSQVRFWSLDTLEQLGDAVPVSGEVTTMELSAGGERWAIVVNQSIEFWDWQNRKPTEQKLEQPALITDIKFVDGANRMLSSDWNGNVLHWDLSASPVTHETWKLDSSVYHIAVSPDATYAATCDLSNKARIWDLKTGRTTGAPMIHYGLIGHLSFDATGQRLITGSLDQIARIWDVATSAPVGSPLRHPLIVNAAAFDPEGEFIWTGSGDKGLRRWRIANGRSQTLPLETNGNVISSAFDEQGTSLTMVLGTIAAGAFVLPGGQISWKQDQGGHAWSAQPSSKNDAWYSVACFSNDKKFIAAGTQTSGVRVWNMKTNQPVTPEIVLASEAKVLVFSPDDQHLLIGTTDGEVKIVKVSTGTPSCDSINLGYRVSAASFFPDGKRLLLELGTRLSGSLTGPQRA